MVLFKNIRTAVKKYWDWRAQARLAKQSKLFRKKRAYEKQAQLSRRDFLKACGRATVIPVAATLIGLPAIYLFKGKSKPEKKETELPPLPSKALTILQNARMSSRYRQFIDTIASLIKQGKIKFEESNTLEKHQSYAIYDSKTNTVAVDKAWSLADNKHFQAAIIHELFHAFQDYHKKHLSESVREAEALLAEYDYLYNKGVNISRFWIIIEELPQAKGQFGFRFSIPHSIVQACSEVNYTSSIYQKAIALIAEYKLWSIFYNIQQIPDDPLIKSIEGSGKNLRQINKAWEKLGRKLAAVPKSPRRTALINESVRSLGKKLLPDQMKISYLIALSQVLMKRYLASGRLDYAEHVYNQTLRGLKNILGPADLSAFDVSYQFDGID